MTDLVTHLLAFWAGGVVVSLLLGTIGFTDGAVQVPEGPLAILTLIANVLGWPVTIPYTIIFLRKPPP